jgi:ABC-type multidrug transport system fused ATPase/permease subunit
VRYGSGREATEARKPLFEVLPRVWTVIAPSGGLLAFGLVLMLAGRAAGLVMPASTRWIIDDVVGARRGDLLAPVLGLIALATCVQASTAWALSQLLSKSAHRSIAELRRRVQAHVSRLPVRFHDQQRTGALVSRIMSDAEGVRNLVGTGLVDLTGGIITALLALILMLRISAPMTALTVGALVVFGALVANSFRTLRPLFRERSRLTAEVTGRLNESLAGIRVVKGYHAEAREAAVFEAGTQRLLDNAFAGVSTFSAMNVLRIVLLGLVGIGVMGLGSRQIVEGSLTVGGLFTYTVLMSFLVGPVFEVVAVGTSITEAAAGLDRIREILEEEPEDRDPRRTVRPGTLAGRVAFELVGFAYDPARPVLADVSFAAEPGTVTALVGPSGAGKSTIIGLIAAFYTPTAGRVLVDGLDLSTIALDAYRAQLGVVLQETFLFDGSIRENVAFSRPAATHDEVLAACRIARVDEFAETFEKSYDTIVGERGVRLSGGQRQRVSIARAILADPRLLILDEATSSLDSESEALIQQGLTHLMRGRTTFVIAHRLSTIRRADQILVVEQGRIVERGTHTDLLAAHGRYHEMYTRQHQLEANLFLAPGEGDDLRDEPEAVSSRLP